MKKILAIALAACMTLTACNTSWVNEAMAILKVALPAALNILTLVSAFTGAPVDQSQVDKITKDIADAEQLLTDYANAAASAKPGALAQLDAVLITTQADLNTILGALHVADQVKQLQITALVSFVIAEITSIESLLPTSTPVVAAKAKVARPPLNARAFRKGYNNLMPDPALEIK